MMPLASSALDPGLKAGACRAPGQPADQRGQIHPGGRIELAVRREGGRVLISVSDNGAGIAEAAFESIFEMFNQAGQDVSCASGGLGIGLSLVRQLVELHGGAVAAASPGPGRGSTFKVWLPLAQAALKTSTAPPASAAPHPLESPPAITQSLRVLIVDDHADAAQMLALMLEMDGHKTAVACDGSQALQTAEMFQPEVAFLDIEMPGMNGYETAQAMRQAPGLEQVVLVALTGWDDSKSQARSKEAGFDHHLSKPTGLATVRSVLSKIVAR